MYSGGDSKKWGRICGEDDKEIIDCRTDGWRSEKDPKLNKLSISMPTP